MYKYKQSIGGRIFDFINVIIITAITFVCLYPMVHVLMASLSSPSMLMKHEGLLLWPQGFHGAAYKAVLDNPDIYTGYMNTLIYVFAGTAVNVALTVVASYVLSRKKFPFRNFFNFIVVLTMFVNGGMVPTYLTVKNVGLIDSRLALILPTAISAYNVILMRTYMSSIPAALEESARIDGASHFRVLLSVIFPLCKPIFAVITLYYAVGNWNSWFNAMIYLNDRAKYPLQLFLREILILNETNSLMNANDSGIEQIQISENIKYATIIVSTVPILCIYPFLQKFFVKGVMIGAVKE